MFDSTIDVSECSVCARSLKERKGGGYYGRRKNETKTSTSIRQQSSISGMGAGDEENNIDRFVCERPQEPVPLTITETIVLPSDNDETDINIASHIPVKAHNPCSSIANDNSTQTDGYTVTGGYHWMHVILCCMSHV